MDIAKFVVFLKHIPHNMLQRILISSGIVLSSIPAHSQIEISPDLLQQHVAVLSSDSLLGRGFGTPQGAKAASYIADQFEEAGIEPYKGTYLHPFNHRQGILNISGINVVGLIPGNDPLLSREYIVLGAHYDHLGWKTDEGDTVVYNGADDNASGTASIIEIGRGLVANKQSLGRSIIVVAFDGEESGLIGSNRFLKDTLVAPDRIKLMFSLDMVGMYKAHGGVDLHGVKQLNDPGLLIEELSRSREVTVRRANGRKPQRTDTAPFGNLQIPAIQVFTGTESPYHKPDDVAGHLDYQGMSQIAGFIADASIRLSGLDQISDLPGPGEDGTGRRETFAAGIRINMGSGWHSYKNEYFQGKSIFAIQTGAFLSVSVTRQLAIQPELLYETTGSQHQEGKFRSHAITIPLSLKYTLSEESMVRTFVQAGGYYSYHLGGKLGKDPIDFGGTFTPHEFGFTYGVGMEAMGLQMGLFVKRGLTSIVSESGTESGAVLPRGICFMLGFIF